MTENIIITFIPIIFAFISGFLACGVLSALVDME